MNGTGIPHPLMTAKEVWEDIKKLEGIEDGAGT
jgi:hypothetical protein